LPSSNGCALTLCVVYVPQGLYKEGRLDIQQECAVTSVAWDGAQWRVRPSSPCRTSRDVSTWFQQARAESAPRATQVSLQPAASVLDAELATHSPVESTATGNMDDIDDDDGVSAAPSQPDPPACGEVVTADRIWVAAGTHADFKADPILAQLRRSHPVCPARPIEYSFSKLGTS
jgi:hypothetical protein